MDDTATFPDWPVKRDGIRAALARRAPHLRHAGPLRPVPGAVVDPGGVAARVAARAVFLDIAGEVEPQLLVELAGAPLDQFAAAWAANGGAPDPDPAGDPGLDFVCRCMAPLIDEDGALWRWCVRWAIPAWMDPPAAVDADDPRALVRFVADRAWGLVEAAHALFLWRWRPLD